MAIWGVMAGGGGSAGWLCWLGRARVVPIAAAESKQRSVSVFRTFHSLPIISTVCVQIGLVLFGDEISVNQCQLHFI